MNQTLSIVALSICVFILLYVNIRTVRELNTSADPSGVGLSSMWKTGILFLLIGFVVQGFDFSNIFESITDESKKEEIAKLIKQNLIYSLGFVLMFVICLVNLVVLKNYRQAVYNKNMR